MVEPKWSEDPSEPPRPSLIEEVRQLTRLRDRARLALRTGDAPFAAASISQSIPIEISTIEAPLPSDERSREELVEWSSGQLRRQTQRAQSWAVDPRLDHLTKSRLIQSQLEELGWWSAWIARLDGMPLTDFLESQRRELEALSSLWSRVPGIDDLKERMQKAGERLFVEQVERDLGRPPAEEPIELWKQCVALSRDEIRLRTEWATSSLRDDLVQRLVARRREWSDLAVERGRLQSVDRRRLEIEQLGELAQSHASELLAHLPEEDIEAEHERLTLLRDDVERVRGAIGQLQKGMEPSSREGEIDRALARLSGHVAHQCQDAEIQCRMSNALGPKGAVALENIVLILVFVMAALIAGEWWWDRAGRIGERERTALAFADLAICSVFFGEFLLKLALVSDRGRFLRRFWLIDGVASMPIGFLSYVLAGPTGQAGLARAAQAPRFFRLLRLSAVVRGLSALRPALRLARLFVYFQRLLDSLVRRHSSVFHRNIILFDAPRSTAIEATHRHLFIAWREQLIRLRKEGHRRLGDADRRALLEFSLEGWERRSEAGGWNCSTATPLSFDQRTVRMESVVSRLIDLTPEEALASAGLSFALTAQRLGRLLDLPILRRMPLIRDVTGPARLGPGEATSAFANSVGQFLSRALDLVYVLADLRATVSAPIFLDRIGATLIQASRRPAQRLLLFGAFLALLSLLVWPLPTLRPLMEWMDRTLVRPILIVGILCLGPLAIGFWFRRLANQAAEFCEQVVEAQFVARTKDLKQEHRDIDMEFLKQRVIEPEQRLRDADNSVTVQDGELVRRPRIEEEYLFLRSIDDLYRDYLEGSLFHRSDTKTTTQLLGNLALLNLRQSLRAPSRSDQLRLPTLLGRENLDSVLGGPFLWFNYIMRAITQQTAKLLVDYNRRAIPWSRLSCESDVERARYRRWLGGRLGIPEESVLLPPAETSRPPRDDRPRERRPLLFETVDFLAVDFLSAEPTRERAIEGKYGSQVLELLRRDRQANIRRAFRSHPLHRAPLGRRTVNPALLYERYFAEGRGVLLPFRVLLALGRALLWGGINLGSAIQELSVSAVEADETPDDRFSIARRKIHRMRRPTFMASLWTRARFDVEYIGLSIPGCPLAPGDLLDTDLSFIGASRRERLAADRLRRTRREQVRWMVQWLDELAAPRTLEEWLGMHFPHLVERSAEVRRAVVAAAVIDHDRLFSLGASIEGIRRLLRRAAQRDADIDHFPSDMPPHVGARPLFPYSRSATLERWVIERPSIRDDVGTDRARASRTLKRFRPSIQGWLRTLASASADDPCAVFRTRLIEVIARSDLWSDQMIALRAIQSLALLDVYHYGEMVWKLGGFDEIEQRPFEERLPFMSDLPPSMNLTKEATSEPTKEPMMRDRTPS